MPEREDWKRLASDGFQKFKLKVGGLVENPVELSLADIERVGNADHIIMHHCIQGWTGIAKWGGLPMKSLVELVRPKANARAVAFFSYGGSLYGGTTPRVWKTVLQAECLLATEMNGKPLLRSMEPRCDYGSKISLASRWSNDWADRIRRVGEGCDYW
jgi:DMSO/TMAO reductase YedYZ molybdopterin-dependent catalytic subunit